MKIQPHGSSSPFHSISSSARRNTASGLLAKLSSLTTQLSSTRQSADRSCQPPCTP